MLELSSIKLRNFRSYGDYDTIIKLDNLGPCLISGRINKGLDYDEANKDTNGSGKSSLVEAIVWCLFGRTSRKAQPGDRVINWFTGKDCLVEITFKNGDKLSRTRNLDGHSDLILVRAGDKDVALGTNIMEQARLDKELDLDWDIFRGSTFFSQYAKPWMELGEVNRKQALEREFHMDKIQLYAETTKTQLDKIIAEQTNLILQCDALKDVIKSSHEQIKSFMAASEKFDSDKKTRLQHANETLTELIASRDIIKPRDLDKLRAQWLVIEQVQTKINERQAALNSLCIQKNDLEADLRYQTSLIQKWANRGDICPTCEQPISTAHIHSKIDTPKQKCAKLKEEIEVLGTKIGNARTSLANVQNQLDGKTPEMTIKQAIAEHTEYTRRSNMIKNQELAITKIAAEQNHYDQTINEIKSKITTTEAELKQFQGKVVKIDQLILHYRYIHSAYHDRRKIKSYMLAEYIPFLNERITHYCTRFDLDLKLEFTNALGVKADKWDYDDFSGGECKRFDVAMMLAMFDLHSLMYGRGCNVVVFDEVDGRLDPRGAEIFTDIIRNDFAPKVDSVLVISQRPDMHGAFPSEIKVIMEDRLSRIDEIAK